MIAPILEDSNDIFSGLDELFSEPEQKKKTKNKTSMFCSGTAEQDDESYDLDDLLYNWALIY